MSDEITQSFEIILREKLFKNFNNAVKEIKKVVMNKYDELTGFVTDASSKTNPALYRDDFEERLDSFSYVESDGKNVYINIPDMETFDFSGRLKVIETILNGIAGTYVEMSLDEFRSIFKRSPYIPDSSGAQSLANEQIYLIRYNNNIQNIEKHLKRKFVVYPFSNIPPMDILKGAIIFTDDNLDKWTDTALEEAQKEFAAKHKGVIS